MPLAQFLLDRGWIARRGAARREIALRVLASMQQHGWICGVPLGVESPALMNGLTGIGFGLLRQASRSLSPRC